ncbi:MAG: hypothetical protein KUG75_13830 [Pseudomonadales bacterium]|nr:hypothetical protein [Pseudomonadales bacterium]
MSKAQYDRQQEDVGNIIGLEHLNVTVPDQALAALFYVTGLGLTQDPYIDFGSFNMWVNAGSQQFHLPKQSAQVLRGKIGLNVPDLGALKKRLSRLEKHFGDQLEGSHFAWQESEDCIDISCPWGNRLVATEQPIARANTLGIPWIEVDVAPGSSEGIARFYDEIMEAPVAHVPGLTSVAAGRYQQLRFCESDTPLPEYDGHHIAIYLVNFSRPYKRLLERGLITIETDAHEYRFQDISDPNTGEVLATIEHEVRSTFHPMFARELVNRDANQSFFNYRAGADAHRGLNHSGNG